MEPRRLIRRIQRTRPETVRRQSVSWYCAMLLACQLVGCAAGDFRTIPPRQVQMVDALTLKLWTDPWPARVGENHIFVEVNAPTRKAMVNRDVLLTYHSADGAMTTVPMQPVPGKIDVFKAVVELESAGKQHFTASVQSSTRPPATALFQLPVIEFASADSLPVERADQ